MYYKLFDLLTILTEFYTNIEPRCHTETNNFRFYSRTYNKKSALYI